MQDRQSYERAVTGSLLGLGLQVLIGLTLLGLAIWLKHPAVVAAAWHAGGGLGIWIILLITFQQHRLERAEALEAEKLSQLSGADGRLFEQAEEDLSVARRRLRVLARYGLPIIALLTAVYLLAIGVWQLAICGTWFEPDAVQPTIVQPLPPLFMCGGAVFLGFVTSRYLSGMARQGVWQLLRGGAGYLMGSVLAALLLMVGFALCHYEISIFLKILIPVIPALMALLGVEIALNLLLDIYRPRKKGEFARPAFDSRLLGLLTAPESLAITIREAINYQFGFEITRSWFWRLLGRAVFPLVGMGILTMVLLSCMVIVQPPQQALILRMGKLAREAPVSSGLHFKWPWPIESAVLYDTSIVHELRLGLTEQTKNEAGGHSHDHHGHDAEATESDAVLWGIGHAHGTEPMWLVGVKDATGETETSRIAASVLNAYVPVQWRIKEGQLETYANASEDPEAHLRLLANRVLNRYLMGCEVNQIMGPQRSEAGKEVRKRLQEAVDKAGVDGKGLGIEIVFVGLSGLHPPMEGEVASSFHDPIIADQERQLAIAEARQERSRILTETAGSVSQAQDLLKTWNAVNDDAASSEARKRAEERLLALLQDAGGSVATAMADARSFRWTHENTERAKVVRFRQEGEPYRAAPRFYLMRRYLEAWSEGLTNVRKYLVLADREKLTIRLDLKDTDIGLEGQDFGTDAKGP